MIGAVPSTKSDVGALPTAIRFQVHWDLKLDLESSGTPGLKGGVMRRSRFCSRLQSQSGFE